MPLKLKPKNEKALQKVRITMRKIVDGKGKPIDKEIFELVCVLTVLGFKTSMSCAGHTDHGRCYPWVSFEPTPPSFLAEKLDGGKHMNAFYMLLQCVTAHNRQQGEGGRTIVIPKGKKGYFELVPFYEWALGEGVFKEKDPRRRDTILGGRKKMDAFAEYLKRTFLQ